MNNLGMLDAWKNDSTFMVRSSAQSYFGTTQPAMATSGSSCGAGDKDKPAPKSPACGSACGAGDDGKPSPKPTACGAGDK